MLKSIIVLLDKTPGGESALRLALDIAKQHDALLTAVSALNLDAMTLPLGFYSEALAYSDIDREKVVRDRQHDLDTLQESFSRRCGEVKVQHDVIESKGSAYSELARAAISHDLVVLGNDIKFGDIAGQSDAAAVGLLLKNVPRPLLVAPPAMPKGADIVIAFDGSPPAARTLQLFVLLGLADGRTVRIVTINKNLKIAEAIVRDATLFLDRHQIRNSARIA